MIYKESDVASEIRQLVWYVRVIGQHSISKTGNTNSVVLPVFVSANSQRAPEAYRQ